MTRLIKLSALTGLSSVYLMQGFCTYGGHGVSILPNIGNPLGMFPNPFTYLTGLFT